MSVDEREALRLLHESARGSVDGTEVAHYLYFQEKGDAERAGEALQKIGFTVAVRRAADDSSWLILGTHSIPPTEEAIAKVRTVLEGLAEECRGEYDGWEAAVD